MNTEVKPPLIGAPGCKDLAAARRIVAQLKSEHLGRTNSNVERQAQSPVYAVPGVGERWDVKATSESRQPHSTFDYSFAELVREVHQNGMRFEANATHGSFGDHAIRSRLEDCEVGDVVPEERAPECVHRWVQIDPTTYRFTWPLANHIEYAEFERLTERLTRDNGHTWEATRFWRRVR